MSYSYYFGDYDDETALVAYLMQVFQMARLQRVNFEVQWEEAAAICWPEYRNSFSFGHQRAPGVKYAQYQVDSTGAIAAWRFMAIADALLTPFNMLWSKVEASNRHLMRDRNARLYFEEVTRVLWRERYKTEANFISQNQKNWHQLGVFGNHAMTIAELDWAPLNRRGGLRYMSMSPGEIYWLENHQGRIDGYIRSFKWTARQAYGRWGDKITGELKAALDKGDSFTRYDFLEFVIPRTDYDPMKIFSTQGKPWASIYVSVIGYSILEKGGYRGFATAPGRYILAPEEWYGRGPAQQVLPELKTLNSEKEAFLKQGALAGDPTYMGTDDLFDFKAAAGDYIPGGMSPDGKPLVGILPSGNIQITKEMMDDTKATVNDAFLTSLFPLLFSEKQQQRSAREVIEVANQMGIFLAPTLGRQYGEYCGSMIDRELDLLSWQGKLPPVPPILKEAHGEYHIQYTSPLARALTGQAIAGFMRTTEMLQEIANATGDPSVMDALDYDVAAPEIAREQFVPERWISSALKVKQRRQGRAQAQQADQQMKALPGQAAIMKAQAITAKAQAGQNIGGVLSGVPGGGMPIVPGNTPGQPGRPGRNGAPGTPGVPGGP